MKKNIDNILKNKLCKFDEIFNLNFNEDFELEKMLQNNNLMVTTSFSNDDMVIKAVDKTNGSEMFFSIKNGINTYAINYMCGDITCLFFHVFDSELNENKIGVSYVGIEINDTLIYDINEDIVIKPDEWQAPIDYQTKDLMCLVMSNSIDSASKMLNQEKKEEISILTKIV